MGLMRGWVLGAIGLSLVACGDDENVEGTTTSSGATSSSAGSGGASASSSASTGSGGEGGSAGVGGGGGDPGTPTIVAVGYGGRRMRSTDLGMTWTDLTEDDANGGDDQNLLRAAVYAQGLFVAAGWRIWTSPDGAQWTERTVMGQQWVGGLDHGNGIFLGAGGCGRSLVSNDGIGWSDGGNATPGECRHVRSLAFGNGVFVAAGDGDFVTTTTDGQTWTALAMEGVRRVRFRDGLFIGEGENGLHKTSPDGVTWTNANGEPNTADFGHGYFFRGPWKGRVERSTDGAQWDEVFNDGGNALQAFAFGYVSDG